MGRTEKRSITLSRPAVEPWLLDLQSNALASRPRTPVNSRCLESSEGLDAEHIILRLRRGRISHSCCSSQDMNPQAIDPSPPPFFFSFLVYSLFGHSAGRLYQVAVGSNGIHSATPPAVCIRFLLEGTASSRPLRPLSVTGCCWNEWHPLGHSACRLYKGLQHTRW